MTHHDKSFPLRDDVPRADTACNTAGPQRHASTRSRDERNLAPELCPAIVKAHNDALGSISAEDLSAGHLNCCDYLDRFVHGLGVKLPAAEPEEKLFFLIAPRIAVNPGTLSRIEAIYREHKLPVPVGIECLPVWYGRSLVENMTSIRWQEESALMWNAVFGWKSVGITQNGYLNLHYPHSLPFAELL